MYDNWKTTAPESNDAPEWGEDEPEYDVDDDAPDCMCAGEHCHGDCHCSGRGTVAGLNVLTDTRIWVCLSCAYGPLTKSTEA